MYTSPPHQYEDLVREMFREFPETFGHVGLSVFYKHSSTTIDCVDICTIKPEALEHEHVEDFRQRYKNEDITGQFLVDDKRFSFMHLRASASDYAAIAGVSYLKDNKQMKRFQEMDKEFIFHHELAHALNHLHAIEYKGKGNATHFKENGSDAYAAYRMIQKYGKEGIAFMRWRADLMQLVSAQHGRMMDHYTTPAMDAVLQDIEKTGLQAIVQAEPVTLLQKANAIADKHTMNDKELEALNGAFHHFVIESDAGLEKIPKPLRDRFNVAAHNLIEINTYAFAPGEAKKMNANASGEAKYKMVSQLSADPDPKKLEKVAALIQAFGKGWATYLRSDDSTEVEAAAERLNQYSPLLLDHMVDMRQNAYKGDNKKFAAQCTDPDVAREMAVNYLKDDAKVDRLYRMTGMTRPTQAGMA